jgi:uncharacterized protein (DUF58 family)
MLFLAIIFLNLFSFCPVYIVIGLLFMMLLLVVVLINLFSFCPVYIAIGLLFMMLLLAVVYEIPEFNLGLHLSTRSDEFEEKGEDVRLTSVGVALPPRYMTQVRHGLAGFDRKLTVT